MAQATHFPLDFELEFMTLNNIFRSIRAVILCNLKRVEQTQVSVFQPVVPSDSDSDSDSDSQSEGSMGSMDSVLWGLSSNKQRKMYRETSRVDV